MPASVGRNERPDARLLDEDDERDDASPPPSVTRTAPPYEPVVGAATEPEEEHDSVLIEADEDRWAWRRKIRQSPRKLAVYRIAVGFAGLFFIVLGLVTGPLPGPGGIPLVLLGLAIWASEFEWAHRLMQYFKLQLHNFRQWSRLKQTIFWVLFFTGCGLFGWGYMILFGIPGWVPQFADTLLQRLPGL